MRRDLRVLEMNDGELLSVLSMIEPKRNFEKSSRHDMQEEIIGWLISNGLTIGHKFSLMVDDRRKDAWMMNLNQNFCNCCEKKIDADGMSTTHRICVIDSDDVRDNNSTMNGVSYHTKGNNPTVHITVPKKNSKGSSSVEPLSPIDLANKVPKPKNGKKKKKEKKGCCGGCCSEWGKFCVDLLSNV